MARLLLSRKAATVKGALMVSLRPKLAQDAAINLNPVLKGVTQKNYAEKIPTIVERLQKALKGKLAADASIDEVVDLLDALKDVEEEEAPADMAGANPEEEGIDADDPNSAIPVGGKEEEKGGGSKAREFLAGKLSAEDMNTYDELMGPAMEPPDTHDEGLEVEQHAGEDAADEPAEREDMADRIKKKENEKPVTKEAMDAAIAEAVKEATDKTEKRVLTNQRAIAEAVREVRPYIGEVSLAQDSAESVYKLALDTIHVDVDGVPPLAYRKFLLAQPVPGKANNKPSDAKLAEDAAAHTGFLSRFPDAARIDIVG